MPNCSVDFVLRTVLAVLIAVTIALWVSFIFEAYEREVPSETYAVPNTLER